MDSIAWNSANSLRIEESDLNTFSQILPQSAVTQRTHASEPWQVIIQVSSMKNDTQLSSSMGAPVTVPKGLILRRRGHRVYLQDLAALAVEALFKEQMPHLVHG